MGTGGAETKIRIKTLITGNWSKNNSHTGRGAYVSFLTRMCISEVRNTYKVWNGDCYIAEYEVLSAIVVIGHSVLENVYSRKSNCSQASKQERLQTISPLKRSQKEWD